LIEGILPNQDSIHRIPYTTFLGSYINLLIRDNLKLIQTRDSQETIQFIELLFQKLQKLTPNSHLLQTSETSTNSTPSPNNQDYLQTIKAKKKDNLDPPSCYILQLAQIPGISTNIASQIASHYPSFRRLYQCYESSDSLAIQNITYPTTTGKSIRVGPKRSQSIYNYLFFE
jgi:ERCC4 domain.